MTIMQTERPHIVNMQTAAKYQDMSAVDALWTLFRQQSPRVQNAFRKRLAQSENANLQSLTTDEAKALTLQRGRDIKAGRVKLIAHDAVMQEMEQMMTTHAD